MLNYQRVNLKDIPNVKDLTVRIDDEQEPGSVLKKMVTLDTAKQ
jgi:hypothetical protein